MKPYLFNYSEEIEMTDVLLNQSSSDSTLLTFTIENNDNNEFFDGTMLSENLEHTDSDLFSLSSALMIALCTASLVPPAFWAKPAAGR